ncbi:MAG: TonB-dependent siderophore receptor [Gammaproteobacteria bacterium]
MARLIIFFALALAGTATPLAKADTAKHRFDIPAQPLGAALQTLADQAGVQMFYAEDSAAGKSTPALRGTYTTREAVDRLLAGTGLHATLTEDGTVTVAQAEPEKETEKETEAVLLPEMTVTAKPTDATSYTVPNATTATKTDTPIFDTPVSIQVVPRKVMDDQQVISRQDALRNISGVQYNSSFLPANDFIIRGLGVGSSIYRDGFRIESYRFETANLDRVEVLKGPAAVLYGRTEPGGLINLVPKKPLPDPYYSLQQQFGSFDLYRTTVDASGPITGDGSHLYRFNLAYQDSDSFLDFAFLDRIFVVPSLTWRITDDTDLSVEFGY